MYCGGTLGVPAYATTLPGGFPLGSSPLVGVAPRCTHTVWIYIQSSGHWGEKSKEKNGLSRLMSGRADGLEGCLSGNRLRIKYLRVIVLRITPSE